jgi:hypothetical protein
MKKQATIYVKRGDLLTTCCGTPPILFKSLRAICSGCNEDINSSVHNYISAPRYTSVSRADSAQPRLSKGAPTLLLGVPEIKQKKALKPLPGQKQLLK